MRATFRETTYRANFPMRSSGEKKRSLWREKRIIGGFSSKKKDVLSKLAFALRCAFLPLLHRIGEKNLHDVTVRSDGNEKSSPRNRRLYALLGET